MAPTDKANDHTDTRRMGADWLSYSYDVAERVTAVANEAGTPLGRYAYDPFGRPIIKTTAAETICLPYGELGCLPPNSTIPAEVLTLA